MKCYKKRIVLLLAIFLIVSICLFHTSAMGVQVSVCRKENIPSSDKWYLSACKSSYILNVGEE